MEKEIRIYYESIEQGAHFVLPTVINTIKKSKLKAKVKLIKLKGNYKYYGQKVAPIIFWKKPDILITLIDGDMEIPLILIEFSNAVFTEDHELQRFDGLVAAAESNCLYVKISPLSKESPSSHGGNIHFDYIKPYALIFNKYGIISFHFDWDVDEKGILITNENYLSCPNKIKSFDELLRFVFEIINKDLTDEWIKKLYEILSKQEDFKEWLDMLNKYVIKKETEIDTSRTRSVSKDNVFGENFLELKLNRFGHAMDPERGMLTFYGTLSDKIVSKMLFVTNNEVWYKDIPKENQIDDYLKKHGLKRGFDFLHCFMLGSGLFKNNDFKNIVSKFEKDSSESLSIDLTEFINNNFSKLNKALRVIFRFSKAFYIEDSNAKKRVIFSWKLLKMKNSFEDIDKTPLKKLTELDEDLVTYITIHNIIKPNKFKILAASYPGAQADRVILIEPGTGRRQKRRYVDIISYLPSRKVTALQEDKGKFFPKEIQKCINEISRYKTDDSYKKALRNFQTRFEPSSVDSVIKVGVGFWSNPKFTISKIKDLDLKELDYFVYITPDMKQWKIWSTGNENIFSKNSGDVIIPLIFEVMENKIKGERSLLEYIDNTMKK